MKDGFLLPACTICLVAFAISILTPAASRAESIINPSFEADGNINLGSSNATGWVDNLGDAKFGGNIQDTNFHTDGLHGVAFLTSATSYYYENSYVYLSQSVDLTGISAVTFDAKLSVQPAGAWESRFEADFYVDSTKTWSQQSTGTYLNQSCDVAGLSGMHTIEFRLQTNSAGLAAYSNRYEFDNVRLTPVPEPSGITFFSTAVVGLLLYTWRRKLRHGAIEKI